MWDLIWREAAHIQECGSAEEAHLESAVTPEPHLSNGGGEKLDKELLAMLIVW
jgi:hypothetical protein